MLFEYIYNNIKVFANAYSKQEKRNIANLLKDTSKVWIDAIELSISEKS